MASPKMVLAREPDIVSWQRTADWIEAKSGVLAVALCLCFAGMCLAVAARRPFWFDEIITISLAHAASTKELFSGFLLGYDQTPPLNALLVRLLCSAFGWTELVARLPATIFATAGLLILFRRIRTLTNGLSGLAAISVLFVSFLPRYAYEARPYAMLFFASVLAVWFWTEEPRALAQNSRRMALLFGAAMMLAVFAHYYAILLILPFAADEWRNRGLRKLISPRLLCGALGLAVGLFAQFRFLYAASQRRLIHFWAIPSLHNLQDAYIQILALLIFALVCTAPLVAWMGPKNAGTVGQQSREERLGWFFLVIPIAGYLLAELVTHAFTVRYFVPVLAGLGLALGCFLYRYYRSIPQVPLVILLVAVALYLETSVAAVRYARTPVVSSRTEAADTADELLPRFREEGKRFILLPKGKSTLEARYYAADPQMVRGLHQPDLPTLPFASDPLHIRYFSMDDVRRFARETAFVAPKPDLLNDLERWGFRLHWRKTEPEAVVYVE